MSLALITVALYARTVGFGLSIIDDPHCVQRVPLITAGLTWDGFIWAFKDGVTDAHWKPLTVLSHMLDCELFGLHAGGHHATNVLLHTASALLLFAVLRRMTGALWPSWLVAAFFAWHPLHVESVAWITERKDVLYGFFWMVALWAYARYAEAPTPARYAAVAAACVAAFLSKSMAITLPCVLLLLDVWPLRRVRLPWLAASQPDGSIPRVSWSRALLEKLPLLAAAVATVSVALLIVRDHDALGAHYATSAFVRNANALVSYVRYIGLTLWPDGLAVFYPLPASVPVLQLVVAVVALLGVTAVSTWQAGRRPWLLVGWLWFVGTVTPVIGFIQPSGASHADRYTYIPQIGLCVMFIWTIAEFAVTPLARRIVAAAASTALIAALAVSWRQIGFWRDDSTLLHRAMAITPVNWFAHLGLAESHLASGRLAEAEPHLKEAMRLRPDHAGVWANSGTFLLASGRHAEARALYHSLFGRMVGPAARSRERFLHSFQQRAKAAPDDPDTQYMAAIALAACDQPAEAMRYFERVLALRPGDASAHVDLGALLAGQALPDRAIGHYRAALAGDPKHALAHANLGGLLSDQGKLDEALVHLTAAHQLQPANLATRYNLALALAKRGRHADAIPHLKAILSAQPGHANALNKLAWILATSPDAALRNGPEALALAGRLQELTGRSQAMAFDTEAAALAECGRFEEALTTARKGIERATASNAAALAEAITARVRGYEARVPFREPAP